MARKKKKKKMTKFNMLLCSLFFILTCLLIYFLCKLQVLPNKIMIIVISILFVLNIVIYFMLRFSRKKIVKLVPILGCAGLFYGVYSLFNTNNILTSMNVNYKTSSYAVLVRSDSSYEKIDDLENKEISYLKDDKEMLSKIKIKYEAKEYEDATKMANDLLNSKTDSMILEQSYIDMLKDSEGGIKDFSSKVKVIYNFEVNTKVNDIKKDVNTTKESFIIYVSGIDTYGSVSNVSRTDANMLVVVNPTTKQILLVSIPRDYYVNLAGKNGKDKFTHSGIYGIDTSVKTLENLFDVDINYYFKINFTSLIKIVDSVDGVDVYSKYAFTSKDGYNYSSGYNHVNGKEALSFVRERKSFAGGDRIRNMNQQALVEALLRKCTNKSIIMKYNNLLNSLKSSFITNMPSNSLTSLIKKQMNDGGKWNVSSIAVDGSNGMEYTYSYRSGKLYVMIPNQQTVNDAKSKIQAVFDGKKLESSYSDEISNIKKVTKTNKVVTKPVTSNVVSNKTSNIVSNNVTTKYTVTYIIDESSSSVTVESGSKVTAPAIPSKDGYEVLGWYLGESVFDFNKPITSNITLVAKYKEEEIVEPENSNSNDVIQNQIEDGKEEEIVSNSNNLSNVEMNSNTNEEDNKE